MSKMYLIAECGRPKEFLEAWRSEYRAGMRAYGRLAAELGAKGLLGFPFERPSSFVFTKGEQPEGWTVPNSNGGSRPKKANPQDIARLDAIPFPERPNRVLTEEFGLPTAMDYTKGGYAGSTGLGGIQTFSFCWSARADGTLSEVIVVAPDYQSYIDDPELDVRAWHPQGSSPSIPEGFRKATAAEVDLIFARDKRDREIYDAQNAEMAVMLDVSTPSDLRNAIGSAVAQFNLELLINFTCGEDGMVAEAAYAGSPLKVHPALRDAASRLAPLLVQVEVEGFDETSPASGRLTWMRSGQEVFLEMDDQENDWSYERSIDLEMLADLEFEAAAGAAPAEAP